MLDDNADTSATATSGTPGTTPDPGSAATPEPGTGSDTPGETPAQGSAQGSAAGSVERPAKKAAKKAAAKRSATKKATTTKSSAKKTTKKAGKTAEGAPETAEAAPTKKAAAKASSTTSTTASATASAKRAAAAVGTVDVDATADAPVQAPAEAAADAPASEPARRSTRKRAGTKTAAVAEPAEEPAAEDEGAQDAVAVAAPLFQAPTAQAAPARRTRKRAAPADQGESEVEAPAADVDETSEAEEEGGEPAARRRRRRGGRRRRKSGGEGESQGEQDETDEAEAETAVPATEEAAETGEGSPSSRRRRRRRRSGDDSGDSGDDSATTVTRVRSSRSAADEITAVSGSTRLEAKKQRRREGREAGRRRAPIVSEAEFLARRESVNRVMVIHQHDDLTQIGVLEDNVLVEHYVARESQTSLIGNVYLGRVQNVLPSMEAAFIDIGKGRNAVLYAGEVNWSALGHQEGQARKIESVLTSGQSILVQVTKDPVGHKGARLTSQISLAGRFLVYVPDGTTSGISRKLPDTERNRLKNLLKDIVPESAGVIVRTAAEGAAEDELTRDVERLKARWEDIEKKAGHGQGGAPQLLYGEPDLTLKVVRDLFTEDFTKLVIQGDDAWDTVQAYVAHVAPDLESRLERYEPTKDQDVFSAYRIDEQIKKGLDRKVWLPSGGSLIIDRTEAMTVIDVNTGKFTGSGGNLEETVTKNNLEAAEEIVRQLRLRDIGGIIVVDFIDMVLESNRDLVLRRLVECLGRDRTRHQVAEVTSLGLVQMTRKRIGTGLLESFSHDCPTCHGRGVVVEDAPVEPRKVEEEPRRARRSRGRAKADVAEPPARATSAPSPRDIAAMARHERAEAEADALAQAAQLDLTGVTGETGEAGDVGDLEAPEPTPDAGTDAEADAGTDATTDESTDAVTEGGLGDAPAGETSNEPQATVVDTTPGSSPEPTPEPTAQPAGESSDRVVQEEDEPSPVAAPEPPRVVTRTRRRSASRPAGPPASVGPSDGGSGAAADASSVALAEPPEDVTPALHVPVKRKGGARKR